MPVEENLSPTAAATSAALDELENLVDELPTIGDLLAHATQAKISAATTRLKAASAASLLAALIEAATTGSRVRLWLINCEYTRRGVPPYFRESVHADDGPVSLMDAMAYDLEWIASQHPEHATFFRRWSGFTTPRHFHITVRYIFNQTRPRGKQQPIYKTLRGLALTNQQQLELGFLVGERIANHRRRLHTERESIYIALMNDFITRNQRCRGKFVRLTDEDKATLDRRTDIWHCGNLVGWSPTETASLYNALMESRGIDQASPMSKQVAWKVIDQVRTALDIRKRRKPRAPRWPVPPPLSTVG